MMMLVVIVVATLPLCILSHGFLPPDDALRHAAKVVSGKSWPEILVMRSDITIDHNPGWHRVLSWVHESTGWDQRMLVSFSVVTMFVLFAFSPLPWLRRPEAWLASLTLMMLICPYFAKRAFAGRPFFLTMAATLILLCMWTRADDGKITRTRILISIVLMALSTWIHGSWYLFVLIPAAFLLAREWRKGITLTFCWVAGSILGAALTGQPWTFLAQSFRIPFLALGQNAPVESLVGEFQPFKGDYWAVMLVAIVFIWRKFIGRSLSEPWRDPIFLMAVLGWLLGFRVFRFWLDWGIPALALWIAFHISEVLELQIPTNSPTRITIGALVAIVLFFGVAKDRDARWSHYGNWEALDASRPEHAEWIPEPGGILYSVNLSVFYKTFFQNPHGQWRYALGFEPSFMLPENLAVYQELWRSLDAIRTCTQWVARMSPADRLVLLGSPKTRPAIRQLEWQYAAENTWVGRLPKNHY
jgi:hypothetical protein